MLAEALLAGAQILKLEKIVQMSGAITLFVGSAQATVNCPSCQAATIKVHSRYERAATDLPWEDIPVRLRLRVRKFFCPNSECQQRIFCHFCLFLPFLLPPLRRRTRIIFLPWNLP